MSTSGERATYFRYVLALALIVRIAIPWAATAVLPEGPQVRQPDSERYVQMAEALVRTGSFAEDGDPELDRTPGYPIFLLPGVWLKRVDLVAIALQIIVGCATTCLVYRLGGLLFSPKAALLGALFFACEPLSALYCSLLLTETLFTCVISAALVYLAQYLRSLSLRSLCISAALVAVAIYIRPIAYFLPFTVGLALLLLDGAPWRVRVKNAGAFVAVSCALVAPWQARNYLQAGYWRFSAISDVNLYYYQAAAVLAAKSGRPLDEVQQELGFNRSEVYFRNHPEQRDWTKAARYAYQREEARRIIRANAPLTIRIHLAGIRGTLTDVGSNAFEHFFSRASTDKCHEADGFRDGQVQPPALNAVRADALFRTAHQLLRVTLLGYLGCALLSLLRRDVRTNRNVWRLLIVMTYFFSLSGGPVGYHRFRLPCVPIIALLAAQGALAVWSFQEKFKQKIAIDGAAEQS